MSIVSAQHNHLTLTSVDTLLVEWTAAGWLRRLDLELARFVCQNLPDVEGHGNEDQNKALIFLSVALVSLYAGQGHVCLDLARCLKAPEGILLSPVDSNPSLPEYQPNPAALLSGLQLAEWVEALSLSSLSGLEEPGSPLVLNTTEPERPLLYLRRMWQYEQDIITGISQRLSADNAAPDTTQILQVLNDLFPDNTTTDTSANTSVDWQKIACAQSIRVPFSIITGGPGTGKTTTVVRLLAALTDLQEKGNPLRIKLAAPTGKAAVRLSDSINAQRSKLANAEAIPGRVTTIHQLLGPKAGSREFKYHAAHPLPADVVVIDEASMVDVEMMARLISALLPSCRLVLLGDKDQLASVEAGAVLGSLCQRAMQMHYLPATAQWLYQATRQTIPDAGLDQQGYPLDQAITMLRFSHRFGRIPGIGEVAIKVNHGDPSSLTCFDGRYPELTRLVVSRDSQDAVLARLVTDTEQGFGYYLGVMQSGQPVSSDNRSPDQAEIDHWAQQVLDAYSRFQLLAVLRQGPTGVAGLNTRIEAHLASRHLIQRLHLDNTGQPSRWYAGRPVMMTRNDYSLGLMNGDIGITLWYPATRHSPARLSVAFPDPKRPQGVRWVSPNRLPQVDTVFAMTVHKSQGSEFAHTALILPGADNPVMTRELIYTAITRASRRFTLIDRDNGIFLRAITRQVLRLGNLSAATCSRTDPY
ncbi:RecBCD enzyme subunit RecD [Pseudohongiella nitratireducens]|uniref:RecBCD enzyme subunit RecD n=1 Tax=Pseudohongiella nitratireducens TaxID=1768907 RepID=A0A917LSZ2_9GAMM|nr:exodeoxyribonuclease V subunit alpha [Pseudohongiella nitratireducens]GGG54948.1 RecBCD enzyme subunit RecD [Pseudohongiella nitratireducens]